MLALIAVVQSLILSTGISLIAYAQGNDGEQLWQAALGGFLIGLFVMILYITRD